jgi:FAD:protein FMN transferase
LRETRIMMGMPITFDVAAETARGLIDDAFAYFDAVDRRFSTYKADSEISAINDGRLPPSGHSAEMREVLDLAEQTKRETDGYFDIRQPDGRLDPSGIVKGWAIRNAARKLDTAGVTNYFVDAGGDIQSRGSNAEGKEWSVGVRNPFNPREVVKVIHPKGQGVATSGSYVRGQHIYDPHAPHRPIEDIVSLTVIGPDVYEADRFATAAFAMGKAGVHFIERRSGLEAYMIDRQGVATMTTGFKSYAIPC